MNRPLNKSDATAKFFSNYIKLLEKHNIPEKQRRWYVRHIETFIKAQSGRKIKGLTGVEVTQYLQVLGRQDRLTGWAFAQRIDAIKILYQELLSTPAGSEVDWTLWFDSAKQLDATHPSNARQLSPEELNYLKQRRGEGPLQEVRKAHEALLTRLAATLRARGYAYKTEQTYEQWVGRFILFCDGASPEERGPDDVKRFLEYLAVRRNVAASTQNQALNALLFLYAQVIGRVFGDLDTFVRAKRPRNLPVVLSRAEVNSLLEVMSPHHNLLASLLYGTGMRLLEGLRLRVQDLDFANHRIHVHRAKGRVIKIATFPCQNVSSRP